MDIETFEKAMISRKESAIWALGQYRKYDCAGKNVVDDITNNLDYSLRGILTCASVDDYLSADEYNELWKYYDEVLNDFKKEVSL